MNNKLYIVYCDDIAVFNTFMSIIRNRIVSVKVKDYDRIKYNILIKGLPNIFSPYNKKDINLITKVSKLINEYNSGVFNKLIEELEIFNVKGAYVFIRVNDLHDVNRLKRYFKRPNYKTLGIVNTGDLTIKDKLKLNKYRFDSKIHYVDSNLLLSQVKLFINKHIPTIKRIKN